MTDVNTKIFGWFEGKNHSEKQLIRRLGPYYDHEANLIGARAYYHTLEDLRKVVTWTKSKRNRIEKCKPGTVIKMHYIHSNGSMFLKRLTDAEIKDYTDLEEAKKSLAIVEEKIQNSVPELIKQKKLLEKEIQKLKKKFNDSW